MSESTKNQDTVLFPEKNDLIIGLGCLHMKIISSKTSNINITLSYSVGLKK